MKKSKLLAVFLIGMLMAVGLVMASCNDKCSNSYGCKYYTGPNVDERWDNCTNHDCAVSREKAKPAVEQDKTVDCDC